VEQSRRLVRHIGNWGLPVAQMDSCDRDVENRWSSGASTTGPRASASSSGRSPRRGTVSRCGPPRCLSDGDRVVVLGHHEIELRGKSHEVPFVHTWQVENGRPTSFDEYLDTARLEKLLAS
jgi:ketosteroid isomerase-like protein